MGRGIDCAADYDRCALCRHAACGHGADPAGAWRCRAGSGRQTRCRSGSWSPAAMSTLMLQILPIWFAALLLGVPLFVSMGLAAVALAYFGAFPLGIVPQKIAQSAYSFPLLAAPLFILMGNIMNSAGITDRIFAFATACVGFLRGGLCHANILASVIFAGMSGSAVADAGGVG